MNYIYDIILNFNEKDLYDFFEWDKNDEFSHVRKIPLFKVDDKTMKDLKNNKVVVDMEFLRSIYKRCEFFSNKVITNVEYGSLFTNQKEVVAIIFTNDGVNKRKSSLLLDEADEVLEIGDMISQSNIKYQIIELINIDKKVTRPEKEVRDYIKKELEYIYKNELYEKLKYLYYEWFHEKNKSYKYMYDRLKDEVNKKWSFKHQSLYQIIKLSYLRN